MIQCARKVAESLEEALQLLEASHEDACKKARFHRPSPPRAQQPRWFNLYIREVDAQQRATGFNCTCEKKTNCYLSESTIDKIHDNRKSWTITYIDSVNGDISRKNPISPFHSEE